MSDGYYDAVPPGYYVREDLDGERLVPIDGVQQQVARILWAHRWYANLNNPPFGRCACDWPPTDARLEINAREHPAHVAGVLMAELNLT